MAQQSTLAAALGEIQELTELEGKAAELRRNGNHLEALKCLERVLLLRQEAYGSNSYEVDAASVLTGEYCNMLAMKCLQERNFPVCQQLLKKAASLAKRSPALQITTYNNFACLFRRQDKLRLALDFLLKAIQIEARLDHAPSAAETHLNACAVLSELGRHSEALEHAQAALILLQEEQIPQQQAMGSSCTSSSSTSSADDVVVTSRKSEANKEEEEEEEALPLLLLSSSSSSSVDECTRKAQVTQDRATVWSVAHHNIGVEFEFLGKHAQSLEAYRKAVTVATKYLGSAHPVTDALNKALQVATSSVALQQQQSNKSPSKKTQILSREASRCYRNTTSLKALVVTDSKTASASSIKNTGGAQSPTKREAKRFDDAYSAYGRIPGVSPPVKAHRALDRSDSVTR